MVVRRNLQAKVSSPPSLLPVLALIVLDGAPFSPRPDRAGVALTNDNAQALLPPHACVFVAK